ncbi:MAG: DUF6502 family protein [Caldimonas sp.]
MKRLPPQSGRADDQSPVAPQHAELALREAAVFLAPVVLWLLRNGVSFPALVDLLKPLFVAAAQAELQRGAAKPTQSALSLLSGVHRKDVRIISDAPATAPRSARPTLAAQVFTRWVHDSNYRGKDGKPRALPRTGPGRTFETLSRQLSNDVHPRTVLDELLRLGQVALEGEQVVVRANFFVPSPRLDEMTALFSANVGDHIAAAVSNLTSQAPPFLEQSIYADGLTAESAELLHAAARRAWAAAFDAIMALARDRVDHDQASDGDLRVRFGSYFFSAQRTPPADERARPRTRALSKRSVSKKVQP